MCQIVIAVKIERWSKYFIANKHRAMYNNKLTKNVCASP